MRVVPVAGATAELTAVTQVWTEVARGLYNPFVHGADLIVDGVVASPHSDWFLDSVAPKAMRHMLPAIYKVGMGWWLWRVAAWDVG